jgi:hypothetical protein
MATQALRKECRMNFIELKRVTSTTKTTNDGFVMSFVSFATCRGSRLPQGNVINVGKGRCRI